MAATVAEGGTLAAVDRRVTYPLEEGVGQPLALSPEARYAAISEQHADRSWSVHVVRAGGGGQEALATLHLPRRALPGVAAPFAQWLDDEWLLVSYDWSLVLMTASGEYRRIVVPDRAGCQALNLSLR